MASESSRPTALRHDRHFRRYWMARMSSLAGSTVSYVALPVLVYDLTGSGGWTALVAAAAAAPYLCFGAVAGAIADRADRRALMVGADVMSAVVMAAVALSQALGVLTATHVQVAAVSTQTLFVFFDAANIGALHCLVDRDRLARANSAIYGVTTAIEVAAPTVAGVLLFLAAPAYLMAFDALSYLVSAILIGTIPRRLMGDPAPGRRTLRRDVVEGVAFLFRHRTVRLVTLVGGLTNIAVAAFLGQLVPWLHEGFGVHATHDLRFAVTWAALGGGGLAASVAFPMLVARFGAGRLVLLLLPGLTLTAVGCAAAPWWPVATVALAAWYLLFTVFALNAITLRQRATPAHLQGRVHTVGRMLAYGLGWPTGALLGAASAQAVGVTAAAWSAALVHAGTLALALTPACRRVLWSR